MSPKSDPTQFWYRLSWGSNKHIIGPLHESLKNDLSYHNGLRNVLSFLFIMEGMFGQDDE